MPIDESEPSNFRVTISSMSPQNATVPMQATAMSANHLIACRRSHARAWIRIPMAITML